MANNLATNKTSPVPIDHATLCDWVTQYEEATVDSRASSEKCRDYNDSKQWTAEEAAALEKRGQAAVVINRMKPKNDGLLGMEKTQRTSAKAYPRTPKEEGAADAATEGIRFVLEDNAYPQIRSAVFDNILVEGTGAAEVIMEEAGSDFRVVINQIIWDRLFYDPHCRAKDFNKKNCRYLGQIKWMDYDDAVYEFPDGKDVLETSIGTGSETFEDAPKWIDGKRRRVKVAEIYYYNKGECYYACFTRGGFLTPSKISAYKNEDGETEWPYVFQSAFVSRECERYGADKQLLDVQDEINKRRSKALHLISVRQVRLERGAVEDVNKTRQELARPDGVIETTPGMEFEVLKTGDMAAAQFNLLTEAKQEIDLVGYNSAASGKDQGSISGVALRQRAQTGQTELAPLFDGLKHFDHQVYRKVWNRIKQSWTAEKWIRLTDDPQTVKWVGLNTQMKDEAGNLVLDLEGKPQITNNVATLDVDIVISDAPDAITTQIEDFQVLGEMVKSGFPMPPEAVIMASPLSHKDRILKMMAESKQQQLPPEVQQQMQQMKEQMDQLAQENQQLKAGVQADMAKVQADAQVKMAELALDRQVAGQKAQLAREEFEFRKQLELEKATHEIDLEERKAAAANKIQADKMEHDCKMMAMKEAQKEPASAES